MWAFLADEAMPRSTVIALREAGWNASDAREVGLSGHPDSDVFAHAQQHGLILITLDMGFADARRFPLGTHGGIVIVRTPSRLAAAHLNQMLIDTLNELSETNLAGALVIVEPGRYRIRLGPSEPL